MKKRVLSLMLSLGMVLALLPAAALAAEPEVITLKAPHTVAELNAKWATLKPVNTANPYTEEPQTSQMDGQPTLGKVSKQALTDGLNSLNFVRYMAGLGSDVSVVSDFQTSAQYAAVLLAYRDTTLTHTPDKPYGLNNDFFQKGYEGTFNSILYRQGSRYGAVTGLADSVQGFLDDGGENNKDKGHRESVLDPLMTGTGMGMATSPSGMTYCAIWTGYGGHLNGSGTKTTNYEAITWPTAGYQATKFFHSGDVAWSIRLNSSRYDLKRLDGVKVNVTMPDGNVITPSHHIGQYGSMIIFYVPGEKTAGEKYQVEVTGLYRKDAPATLRYTVEFFELGEAGSSTEELLAADKVAVEDEVKSFSFLVNNYTQPEEVLNCVWAATRYVDSVRWSSGPTVTPSTSSKTGTYKGTLKCTLDGQSFTCDVKMTIPKHTKNDNVYRAANAAKAMKVSGATTAEDVVAAVNPALDSGCTAAVSNFNIITAPTAADPGKLSYYLYTRDSEGKQLARAGVVQIIPPLGRELPGTPAQAIPTNDRLTVNGVLQTPTVYKINGNNYFKLRDLAVLLNGTSCQFGVGYDAASSSVTATSGQGYAKLDGDMAGPASGGRTATVSNDKILVNGQAAKVEVYKIDGGNYFKLRDLGTALGFEVGWDDANKVASITTNG